MTLTEKYLALKDPAVKYNFIEREFTGWQSNPMPMSLRKIIQVQLSNLTRTAEPPLGDNRSRHIKAFMAATLGAGFTVAARIFRIAVWTFFFIPAIVVRSSTASRYGVDGAVQEFWTRYKEELWDLGIALSCIPLGLKKSWNPAAYGDGVEKITQTYLQRAERNYANDKKWAECQKKYEAQVAASAEVRARREEKILPATSSV